MKISISAKLFVAVLATAAFAVLAMGFAAHWSFERGFLGYLNEQAIERVDAALPRLAEAYRQRGGWDYFRDNPAEFRALMRPLPVNAEIGNAALPGKSPSVSDLTGAMFRMSLLDAQQRVVLGYREIREETVRRAITVDGRTVGWVAMAPFQSVSTAGDKRFERHQWRASVTVGAVCVLFAAVIALWVARHLLRPVKRIAQATHRLAAGEYTSRVPVGGDDEVGRLAQDFNTLAEVLQKNEQQRRDFMADVSHELRTPLGVLHGELEAIEDGVRSLSAESVKSLQAEVATLNKLVSDLYDLSLADVGALAYRKFEIDLAEVLQVSVAAFHGRLAERRITLDLRIAREPLIVSADERRLQQLFNNLMVNTLRYTDAGGMLRVECRREGTSIVIDFVDSTPGVSGDGLARLFDRFYRVEGSRNRASGGAGLGLAIVRSIVIAHDGQVEAKASPLGGLWIAIRLPALLQMNPA